MRRQAVVEALKTNQSLTDIKTEDFDRTTQKAWFKHVQTVSRCFGKCSGCGPSLAGDFVVFPTLTLLQTFHTCSETCSFFGLCRYTHFHSSDLLSLVPFLCSVQMLPASPLPRGTGKSLEEEQIHQGPIAVRRAGPFQGRPWRCRAPVINTWQQHHRQASTGDRQTNPP